MFDNIRKKKQQTDATTMPFSQGGQTQRINVDVNQQYAPQQPQKSPQGSAPQQVYTMPEQFLPQQNSKNAPTMTVASNNQGEGSAGGNAPKSRKKLWIILVIVIVAVLLGLIGAVAYVFVASSNQQQAAPATEQVATETASNETVEDELTNTSTAVPLNSVVAEVDEELNAEINEGLFGNENANTNSGTNSAQTPQDFSDVGDTTDTDQDGLTDEEEINIYDTREKGPDTDGDGYIDGTEVKSLFSPLKADQTLLKSGLVIEEKNKDFGWSIYYPAPWLVEPIDDEGREVLFTPDKVDTEFVEIIVQDNDDNLTAEEWYTEQYEELDPDSIETVTVGGLKGIMTSDGFTYYLADNKYIIGIIYNVGNSQNVHFRTTFEMMVDSFIYSGSGSTKKNAGSTNTNTNANTNSSTNTNSSANANTNAQ